MRTQVIDSAGQIQHRIQHKRNQMDVLVAIEADVLQSCELAVAADLLQQNIAQLRGDALASARAGAKPAASVRIRSEDRGCWVGHAPR